MNRKEVVWLIKRNNHGKKAAITLISDFLVTTKEEAGKIYEEEFGNQPNLTNANKCDILRMEE